MLIVNADDWGRSIPETDAALKCYQAKRITSVSAMVFMADSERAADLARAHGLQVGLHLNFSEPFSDKKRLGSELTNCQSRLVGFLNRNKYSHLLYNPFLRSAFSYSYRQQADEFMRLYRRPPSHIDGHHHMHLSSNLLLSNIVPSGTRLRRNFSFWAGEKSWLNRTYRALVDRWLMGRYHLPDFFFDLTQCIQGRKMDRVRRLAALKTVELMTHPIVQAEADYLMSNDFEEILRDSGIAVTESV